MDTMPLDEVARISCSEINCRNQTYFKENSEADEDLHMPMTPGLSIILRIETIPDGFNSAQLSLHIPSRGQLSVAQHPDAGAAE
jgi:hypothetical protein